MIKDTLYYKDNYLMEFDTLVIDCIKEDNKIKLVLEETAFYPEGGGQPSDIGEIDGVKVTYVEEKDNIIYHVIEHDIEVGKRVHCKIDFENRFENMQNHSGEHIVSGLICKYFNASNVGFHMGDDCVTMDFNTVISEEQLREIELLANEAIYKNLDVKVDVYSKEEAKNINFRSKKEINDDIRIVTIPGYDICACCGVHVTKTGEIGIIKLLSVDKYKSGVRISMLTGKRALENYTDDFSQVDRISTLLSLKHNEVYNGVFNLKEELEKIKREKCELYNKLCDYKINLLENGKNILLFEENLDSNEQKVMCEKLKAKVSNIAGVFCKNLDGYNFIMLSKDLDLREVSLGFRERFSGKCGGKTDAICGQVKGTEDEIKAFIDNF